MGTDASGGSARAEKPRKLGRGLASLLSTSVRVETPIASPDKNTLDVATTNMSVGSRGVGSGDAPLASGSRGTLGGGVGSGVARGGVSGGGAPSGSSASAAEMKAGSSAPTRPGGAMPSTPDGGANAASAAGAAGAATSDARPGAGAWASDPATNRAATGGSSGGVATRPSAAGANAISAPAASVAGASATGASASAAAPQSGPVIDSSAAASFGLQMIAIGEICPGAFQPRRVFDEAALRQLASSIVSSGLMQPVIVRRIAPGSRRVPMSSTAGAMHMADPPFELIAGERRWRAAQMAGLVRIPAIVRNLTDDEAAQWAVVENVQREDLNPMERAEAFAQLVTRFGLTHGEIATRVGVERPTVANFVRLMELEPEVRELLSAGKLGFAHGRALLSLAPGAKRVALASRCAGEQWSVRQLERTIAAMLTPTEPKTKVSAIDAGRVAARSALEKSLGEHLGTKVSIQTDRSGTRGRMVIEFYGLDHFDGLLGKMKFEGGR